MGIKERREREKETTREKILDAARDLFVREGYDAVSMRKIAEAIEYSPTAIYVHFKDKDALFHALCSADFATLGAAMASIAKIADPVQRIRQAGYAYVKFAVENPNHYRLMFMTPKVGKPDTTPEESLSDPDCSAYAFLRQAVGEAIAAGRFLPAAKDLDAVACTFWSAVHGVASLHIIKSKNAWINWPDLEQLTTLAADGILRGLLKDPSELPLELPAEKAVAR